MTRAMLLNPIALALSALLGVFVCRMAHIDPHLREMAFAIGVCLIAAEAALIPLAVFRKASIAVLAQASLAGMGIYLLLNIILAVVVLLLMQLGRPFAYWMLTLFWTTLPVVSIVFVKALRSAAPTAGAVTGTRLN
jgi:hypothetical protein